MNIGNLFGKISETINNKKIENELYNKKLNESKTFNLEKEFNPNNSNLNEGKWEEYMLICPNINIEQAKLIDSLIPISETVINIVYSTEQIDSKNFILVFTNFRIFIIDKDKYDILDYQNITNVELISKGLMTQMITINDILLGLDINQNNLNIIYGLLTNTEYRNNYINEKTKYLCGIIPIYQRLNKINSGISLDNNNNVVFHDKKINNYLYNYDDILNYELLEDNMVVLKKKTIEQDHSLKSVKNDCSSMKLRVTLKNNGVFEINILEPSTFNTTISHNSSTYSEYFSFSKEIIDKLDSLNKELDIYK